jgi:catecholate siderophore receptor
VPTIGLPGYTSPDPKRPLLLAARRASIRELLRLDQPTSTTSRPTCSPPSSTTNSPRHQAEVNTSRYGKTKQDYLLSAFMGTAANIVTAEPADPVDLDAGAHHPHRQGPGKHASWPTRPR